MAATTKRGARGGKRPGSGRKPGKTYRNRVMVAFNDEQMEALEEEADELRKALGTLIRELAVEALERRRK